METSLRHRPPVVVSPPEPAATRRIKAASLLVVCGVLLAAVVLIGAAGMLASLRHDALTDSDRELRNAALILADQTDRAFQAVDLIQSSLIERLSAHGARSAEDYERLMSGHDAHLMLKDKVSGWPHIGSITLINAKGKLFNFSRFWPLPEIDVTDREFFKALKSDVRLTSYMGEPVRNRATGSWTIHLVRKVAGPNGEFLGLVLGAMEMAYFDQYFGTISLGRGGRIVLFREDGVVLARHPAADPEMARSYLNNGPLLNALSRASKGTVQETISIDGEDRLLVAQRLAHYPFVVATTKTVAAALSEWRNVATYISGATLLLIMVIGIIVLLGVRQIRNYEVLVQAHAEANQRIQLDAAINNMSSGLLMFDASERLVVLNRRYIELFGLSPEVVKPGCAFRDLIVHRKESGTFSGDVDAYCAALRAALARNENYTLVTQSPEGRIVQIHNVPMPNGGWVATHEDITERRNAMSEIERTRAFLDTVIENVPVTVFVKEAQSQRYILVNRAAEELWGVSRDDVIGKTAHEIFPKPTADLIAANDTQFGQIGQPMSYAKHWIETPSKGSVLVETRRIMIFGDNGEPRYLLGVVENITERVRANERISYMAHHDLLTGLTNRALFLERIEEAGARQKSQGDPFGIFMLDLDRFKDVNDSLGHPAGDMLLREVAQRLKSILREHDVLARLGGDEFAILSSGDARNREDAGLLAGAIIASLLKPFDIEGSTVAIGASIGIALAPDDGVEPNELMKKADLALYRKKSEGRNGFQFFDARMTADADARHQLAQELRNAVSNGEIEVHYQPIIDASTRKPCGVEALARWRHPTRGNIPPLQFIPLAEECGFIVPLGEWVLQRACTDAAAWPSEIKVAVNLSPAQFKSSNLLDVILCALVELGLPPERLELEITESVLIESHVDVLSVIRQLKNIGVSIALDDFGTGYSSLSYLTMFPFDKIKIDRSFTQNMTKRAECAAIVSSVLALGRGLGTVTTAEGVETEEQFELLRASGVNTVQGYLFGRPCPVSEIELGSNSIGRAAADAA